MIKTDILKALEQLGNTSDEIAEALSVKEIKGRPRHSTACPIAHYLKDALPECETIHVCIPHAYLDSALNSSIPLPAPVKDFIRKFDAGEYLNLKGPVSNG